MKQGEQAVFCPGICPLTDPSLVVEATRVIRDAHGAAARVICTALSSNRGSDEVGSEAVIRVMASEKSPQEVIQDIADCTAPKRTRMQKLLGLQGTCQGVDFLGSERPRS